MNTALKITAFTAALAATFGAAYALGGAADPLTGASAPAAHADHAKSASPDRGGGHSGHSDTPAGGLQVSESGYSLDLATPRLDAGKTSDLRFAVRDRAGRPVTAYQRAHGKELHLILASHDLATYQHLHPIRADDGTWATPVTLPAAGDYRLFADFTPTGRNSTNLTLGADLAAAGPYKPAALPKPSRTATVDGYTVTLNGGLRPGAAGELTLNVSKDGRPVTDLQPYLGAYGHLVALRSGDLAYLHVHPNGEPGDGTTRPGPEISFTATAPSSAAYRLFLDFKHNGTVRTAAFTVQAGTSTGAQQNAEPPAGDTSDGHQH
ncbi:hypothetical protein [Streptomyces sp. NPDC059909]|uniref:hypothetical protein n=1 Tax=Streptomyces sp. NPDC059909 TaxID=3346998 RepID=UPI00364B2146